jgi:hypothetical protein
LADDGALEAMEKIRGSRDDQAKFRADSSDVGGMWVPPVSNLSICSLLVAATGMLRRDRRRGGRLGLSRVAIALAVSGCGRAPTMDLLGSYFPAWMLCAAIGVLATIVVRRILAMTGIDEYVVAPLPTYAGLALSATFLAWLLWFGH